MNEKTTEEEEAIEKALTQKYIPKIVKDYGSGLLKSEGWQEVEFTPGVEDHKRLTQMIKQLIYFLARAEARKWMDQNIKRRMEQKKDN